MDILLANSDKEITECFPVVHQLRPHLELPTFLAGVKRMKAEGYRLVFLADSDVRAVAGFRKMETLATGRILYVDDLVTDMPHRSQGYGERLLRWLMDEAIRQDCQYLALDCDLRDLDAHCFYKRNGVVNVSFRFQYRL